MSSLVFVDCWPEIAKAGYWKRRFTAIPAAATQIGLSSTVLHYTRLDIDRLMAVPPLGIILSGSRSNLVDDPHEDPRNGIALAAFADLSDLLTRCPQIPVLGICFGLQYLTVAAGGLLAKMAVERCDPAWAIEALTPDPLFAGLNAPRCVENHAWRVERPGSGWHVVARSRDGIEALRHDALPRVGVQFHPEYHRRPGATADGERILLNWLGELSRG